MSASEQHLQAEGVGELDPKRWLILAVTAIAQLMIVLDATIVTIALPSAQTALHISTLNRQWVVTAYTLTFGGLLLLGGRIADYVGRKRIFIIGLVGFALASALGGLAQNEVMLFAARALQGSFAAILAPSALSIITVTFTEPKERAKAFGVYGAIAGGGSAIGLIAGGVLTQYASWRWCLLVNIPIAIIAIVAALRVVHESKAEGESHYDVAGAVISTLGFVSLVYGFTKADTDGWSSGITLSFILGAVVLLALFVVVELRREHPLLPMRILMHRDRGGSYFGSFMAGTGLFGMFLFLTYYLQQTLGYSPLKCGIAYLPFSVALVMAAGFASKLLPKYGPRPLMTGGFLAGAVGLFLLTSIGVHSSYVSHVLPAMLVISAGLGFAFVTLSDTALVGVRMQDAGVASALVNTTQQIGGSLGASLLNTIAASSTASFLVAHHPVSVFKPQALVHGYISVFWVSTALLAAAGVASAFFIRSKNKIQKENGLEAAEIFNPTGLALD